MYLTSELGVGPESVNLWSGIVFSASFLVSAIMAPVWGRLADTKGKRIMAMRASFLLAISYFLGGIVTSPEQLTLMRLFQGFASGLWPMDLAIMTLYGATIHRAVATAAGFGAIIAVPGTIGMILNGWGHEGLPPFSLGHVSLLGLILIVPATMLSTPLGVAISHRLGRRTLRQAFGLFLCLTALRMAWAWMG